MNQKKELDMTTPEVNIDKVRAITSQHPIEPLNLSCDTCIHQRTVVKEITRIYCHRVLHSNPRQHDSPGHYPLVQTIEQSGNGWACGTCSFYKPFNGEPQ